MKKYLLLSVLSLFLSTQNINTVKAEESETEINEISEINPNSQPESGELIKFNMEVGKKLVQAIDDKKLSVTQDIEILLVELSVNGYCILREKKTNYDGEITYINHSTYGSRELMNTLLKLVESPDTTPDTPFIILSLFRLGGNHGEVQANGDVIGRAVDIYSYAGCKINIEKPDIALQGIDKIIGNLPHWRYNFGLPRPGGDNKIEPSLDYFLPVNDLKQARRSPTGTINGDLNLIKNEDAKIKLTQAITNNKDIEVLYMFPDATNHIHIKAIEDGKMQ